jgi:SAM-dependent methyltransferase
LRIKTAWLPHLHRMRTREIEIAFGRCPEKIFAAGLELGAGDGFQSGLLMRYVSRLTCTDYTLESIARREADAISYRACDAEEVDAVFGRGRFDLVFSSSLMEHVPDPGRALRAVREVMAEDGVTVHVIPGPFWKVSHFVLHVPNQVVEKIEALTARATPPPAREGQRHPNNPKTARPGRPLLSRLLVPAPHGVSATNREEFAAFRRARWEAEFRRAGLDPIAVLKGPVASGYGFGLDRLRASLETLGFASEYIYIAARAGRRSRFARYFQAGGL